MTEITVSHLGTPDEGGEITVEIRDPRGDLVGRKTVRGRMLEPFKMVVGEPAVETPTPPPGDSHR